MSRHGGKTYTRRKTCTSTSSSVQFDQLLSDNNNKPSTAKVSVAGVHRWGMTTFTSIRKSPLNGLKDGGVISCEDDSSKRSKLNFKDDESSDPFNFDSEVSMNKHISSASIPSFATATISCDQKSAQATSRPNKFFKSSGMRSLTLKNSTNAKNFISSPSVPFSPICEPKTVFSADLFSTSKFRTALDFSKQVPIKVLENKNSVLQYQKGNSSTKELFDMLLNQDIETFDKKVNQGQTETKPLSPACSTHSSNVDFFPSRSVNECNSNNSAFQMPDHQYISLDVDHSTDKPKIPGLEKDNLFSVENIMKMPCSTASNQFIDLVHGAAGESSPPYRTYGRNHLNINQSIAVLEEIQPGMDCDTFMSSTNLPGVEFLKPSPLQFSFNPTLDLLDSQLIKLNSSNLADNSLNRLSDKIDMSGVTTESQQGDTCSSQSSNVLLSQSSDIALSQKSDIPVSEQSEIPISSVQEPYFISSGDFVSSDWSQETNVEDVASSSGEKSFIDQKLKSSKKIFSTPKKFRAVYKVRAWHEDDKEEFATDSQEHDGKTLVEEFEGEPNLPHDRFTLSKRINKTEHSGEITSWKCEREVKELYTVVHNVKQAHQCHESGETQEFNDDVEYLLEGVQITSSLGTRCLSILGWASKCMVPSFRIHLRAHGIITRVFSALMDAPSNLSLSLCTATLMFVLSQDRLTMDLEASTLSLMLQLLECNVGNEIKVKPQNQALQTISPLQAEKIKEKVCSLCEQMQLKGYAKQLDINNVTGGILAMETLLSLSSRRTGEWFKEEIRMLGGLDYIVDTVKLDTENWCSEVNLKDVSCVVLDKLRKIDRCLRVIENVTYMDSANQSHLIKYKKANLVTSCLSLLKLCRLGMTCNPVILEVETRPRKCNDSPGGVLFACILTLLKVLFNLSHENPMGSTNMGANEGVMECILLLLLQTPISVPQDERFDLLVLSLGLLINLVEHCQDNRDRMVMVRTVSSYDTKKNGDNVSGIEALIEMFLNRLELAKQSEEQTDAILDSQSSLVTNVKEGETSLQQNQADQMEETLTKTLQKAGKNMEHSMIAAYIALLLGWVIQNPDYARKVKAFMPNENFDVMIELLNKFLNFVNLTGVVSTSGMKSVKTVLAILETS